MRGHSITRVLYPAAQHQGRTTWLLLLALALVALLPLPAHAKYASFVIDATTGEVLHEVNADVRNYPASLTKMMTLYLVFESLEEGRMRLDDRITMTKHAANQPPSKMGIKVGKTFSVEDAIRALAIKSANDIAAAVAEHVAGSEEQFALIMTAKARDLGMKNTTFRNASGLPHNAQMSTARDMAKLARAMLRNFPHRYHYFSEKSFSFAGQNHKTHNQLLTNYEGTDGIKTGYIRASGFNLVASVKRGDKRLIGVVFGADNSKSRNKHMVELLEKGWAQVAPQLADANTKKKTKLAQNKLTLNPAQTALAAQAAPIAQAKPNAKLASAKNGQIIWGVQVGAYKEQSPAYEIAVRAINMAPNYLAQGSATVAPLEKKNGHILYRSWVMGISKTQAYSACKFLEKKKMGCMPLKITTPVEVAALD